MVFILRVNFASGWENEGSALQLDPYVYDEICECLEFHNRGNAQGGYGYP